MERHIEPPKFELLRAKWEAQQQGNPNNDSLSPTTPGRTPAQQRQFYTSSSETRDSKIRRFSSFAAFTTPINPFARRDRVGMPFPKSPSYKALVAPDEREDPPSPLKRRHGSRLSSFKTASHAMPPPPLPAAKANTQAPQRRSMRLPRSQTTSNIPLLTASAPEPVQRSPIRRPPSGIPSRKTTGLRQPSQSASNLIRSRPPTPHRSADEPMPVTAQSTNNLISLTSLNSFANICSKLPTPAMNKEARQLGTATKMFGGMVKAQKARDKRSYTQPNLTSATTMPSQFITPRKTAFREEFATKTPRYMASENAKPLSLTDDLFAPADGLEVTEVVGDEELRRYGARVEDWGSPHAIETPPTIKPNRTSGTAHSRHPSQLPRLHSSGSLPQNGLLAPLSPPFPRTPRHSTAHSQSLLSPGSGANPPTILRHSHLSPCLEDSHTNPRTAIRFISTGQLRAWSPPSSPTPTHSSHSSSFQALPPSPTPASGGGGVYGAQPPTHALVNTAQPSAYWAGRFASCFDRLRFEAFHTEGRAFRLSGRVSDTFGAFVDGGEETRARRVFSELSACCRSDEAARSLRDFQAEWARRCGSVSCMPPPAVIVLGGSGESGSGVASSGVASSGDARVGDHVVGGGEDGLRGGEGKGRKTGMGFMERLRGIARKTSA
ncbi:hypothetical protein DBV05_g4217 [Lasiodiplodia theobromae]|uniref:Uncharacterized protein n=1 Tax=Lasiodiplodia theobromae TaxID=45133 RepID=A0A5N5DH76_9PEZI|nr:hypothetical protein DBV05_g4217 [Lasiodiplodia theobromae]